MTPTQYEAHITIEPVFGDDFDRFHACCMPFGFRPAELLLRKQRKETQERSSNDSFCTGHAPDFEVLKDRVERLVDDLQKSGFSVWRYKIEGILLDVRMDRLYRIKEK